MIAVACSSILIFIAGFHCYWGFGGQVGIGVAVPQRDDGEPIFKPSAAAAQLIGLALLAAACCVLAYSGLVALPVARPILRVIVAFLALIFTGRALGWFRYAGFFKTVRHTRFAACDTWFYCPLCLLLGVGLMFVLST